MEKRKIAKTSTLVTCLIIFIVSFLPKPNWYDVGIYAGCDIVNRLIYIFYHANIIHASLNAWCLLSLVFIYNISVWRILLAIAISVTIPVNTLSLLIDSMSLPTVGISSVVFTLFGSISFEVQRKWYYQGWMFFYLAIGFLFPNTNAWLHLYCYIVGFIIAFLNKPVKRVHYVRKD